MQWFKLYSKHDVPKGNFIRMEKVGNKKLCIVKDGDTIYAVQNTCPHAGGILSGGWCEKKMIICPVHRYSYSLETGRGAEGQGDYINTYPIETRADGIYVGLKESWWKHIFGA